MSWKKLISATKQYNQCRKFFRSELITANATLRSFFPFRDNKNPPLLKKMSWKTTIFRIPKGSPNNFLALNFSTWKIGKQNTKHQTLPFKYRFLWEEPIIILELFKIYLNSEFWTFGIMKDTFREPYYWRFSPYFHQVPDLTLSSYGGIPWNCSHSSSTGSAILWFEGRLHGI